VTEPLVILPASEVKRLMLEALAEVNTGRNGDRHADERPVTVKQAAKHFGMDDQRLRDWCEHGCDVCGTKMPHIMTSDERGLKLYLNPARHWMEHHRTAGGCCG